MTAPGRRAAAAARAGGDAAQRLLAQWLPASLRPECPEDLAALLRGEPDGTGLGGAARRAAFARAHAQGIAPLLWASLARWDLEAALDRESALFRGAHGATLRQNLLHLEELGRITRRLRARGIEAILLKGAAFLGGLYPHPALRPMADLDLLVRPGDLAGALRELGHLGYRGLRPGVERCLLETNHEIELTRALADGTPVYLELHWRLLPRESLVDAPAEEPAGLWDRAPLCVDPEIEARVMAPEDALLFSAMHLQRHVYSRAIWFVDMALLIARGGIDWGSVSREAASFGARAALHAALEGASAICGVTAPPEVMAALHPGPLRGRAVAVILRWSEIFGESAVYGERALPARRRYLLKLLQARDTLAALRRLAGAIHPSEPWLRARYGIRGDVRSPGLRRRHLASALRAALGPSRGTAPGPAETTAGE